MNPLKGRAAVLAAALLFLCGRARAEGNSAGASVTGGSGYSDLSSYAGHDWELGDWSPFLYAQASLNTYTRTIGLKGGGWRELAQGRWKAEAGLTAGRYRATGERTSALYLEGALERDLGGSGALAGAGWRLSSSALAADRFGKGGALKSASKDRGKKFSAAAAVVSGALNELSAYLGVPAGPAFLRARAGLTLLPGGEDSVRSETLGASAPLGEDCSLAPSVTFTQGGDEGTYFTLGLDYSFE